MKRLAVIPSEPITLYLSKGHTVERLISYYNPAGYFDKVFLLSPLEHNHPDLLGMDVIKTEPHQLQRRIKELRIDIVRAYGGYWAGNMACNHKVSDVPVVVSIHDARASRIYDSIRKADIIFCMSNVVKKTVLQKFKFNNENLWVIPNRVDFNVMHPYPANETADLNRRYPYKFKIIHVGRKVIEKNLGTVIKALKILGENYGLLAIGKGDTDKYMQFARTEGVIYQCHFLDSINNNELSRYYSWADCMCTPSLCEGFGMVFIEALACNSIVVTSDIELMNEYIKSMKNGILVKDYHDPLAIADAIKQACTNQALRDTIKNNARSSVEQFEKSRIDDQEATYYDRILNMRAEGSFSIPLEQRLFMECEKHIKNFLPISIKNSIRNWVSSRKTSPEDQEVYDVGN